MSLLWACTLALLTINHLVNVKERKHDVNLNLLLGDMKNAVHTQSQQDRIIDIDTGSGLTFKQDRPRYDRLAIILKQNPSLKAYIIVYGGQRGYTGEAITRARCIKNRLVLKHKIDSKRVVTINGGYRSEIAVELYALTPSQQVPSPVPTIDPSEVELTKIKAIKCRCK